MFILAHSFRGFSPQSHGSVLWAWGGTAYMAEMSPHGSQEAKRQEEASVSIFPAMAHDQ
jgi:hypothetical protein